MTPDRIDFLKLRDPYGFMSNFAPYTVEVYGRVWQTSEHAYQAQKFRDISDTDYEAVFSSKSPWGAAKIGRDPLRKIRHNWDDIKDDVMRFVVVHKFLQHKEICDELLSTGDVPIFEHASHDKYWADGGDGSGRNMMGVVLMEAREILREELVFRQENPDTTSSGPVSIYVLSLKL